jgi:hypothetical protein
MFIYNIFKLERFLAYKYISCLKRYLTYNGDTMEPTKDLDQNTTVAFDYTPVEKTFEKELFSTMFKSFQFSDAEKIDQQLIKLSDNSSGNPTDMVDLMKIDDPAVTRFKEVILEICSSLEMFSKEKKRTPVILSSNTLFQQKSEHIPLHCYEFAPLVFTFVANSGPNPPTTYFADTRGGVQTVDKNLIGQNLVGTGYGIKGRLGEIFVTPGYVQRYTETNLDNTTYVTINVLVSFVNQ